MGRNGEPHVTCLLFLVTFIASFCFFYGVIGVQNYYLPNLLAPYKVTTIDHDNGTITFKGHLYIRYMAK